jgi:uncharacterized protein YraI
MSLKSKLVSLGLAATMVVGTAAAALAAPAWATTPVNVRSAPVDGRVLDTLRRGEQVDIDYCRGSWCYVDQRRGPSGWVSANYLSRGGDNYDDDDYYDDRPVYIERPRRYVRPYRPHVDTNFCVGNPNASFCLGTSY